MKTTRTTKAGRAGSDTCKHRWKTTRTGLSGNPMKRGWSRLYHCVTCGEERIDEEASYHWR